MPQHKNPLSLTLSLSLLRNFPKENNNRRPWVHAARHKNTVYFSTILRDTKSPENNNNKNRKTEAQQTSGDGEEQLASNDNVPVQREGRGEDVEGQWGGVFKKLWRSQRSHFVLPTTVTLNSTLSSNHLIPFVVFKPRT
jgi:hypothetical protein